MFVDRPVINESVKRGKIKFVFGKAVIIVYRHSPCLLNVTGLKSSKEIRQLWKDLESRFKLHCFKIRIDNIFYSHKDKKVYNLFHLFYFLKGFCPEAYSVDYNVEIFPGMFLKSKSKTLPTLILFTTGSYSIIGAKSFDSAWRAKIFVNKLFSIASVLNYD